MPRDAHIVGPCDLHLHSVCSDGTQTPTELMRAVHEHGVRTVALTDHDTTDGWAEASATAVSQGMTFLPGMELSAKHEWRSVHVLAYLFDAAEPALRQERERIRGERVGRAERIVQNISRDFDLTWEDVQEQTAPGATVGRPHIADALVARGLAVDRTAAFAGILHPRSGYYVPHAAPDALTAVRLISGAGGVAVIAHPATSGRERIMPEDYWEMLVDAGLGGIEIEHRENTASGKKFLRAFAARHDLIITGSSDYHGAGKPNLPGENTTDPAMVERIVERATGNAPTYP